MTETIGYNNSRAVGVTGTACAFTPLSTANVIFSGYPNAVDMVVTLVSCVTDTHWEKAEPLYETIEKTFNITLAS